jgi:hypothetical protein
VFAAPRTQLSIIRPLSKSHHRISLSERKKQMQLSGKGHNELLEIANPLVQTRVATNACQSHTSENRGTRWSTRSTWFWLQRESLRRRASLQQIRHKNQHSHKLSLLDFNASWLVNKCRDLAWFYLRASEFSGRPDPCFLLTEEGLTINGNNDCLETYSFFLVLYGIILPLLWRNECHCFESPAWVIYGQCAQ